MYSKEQVLKEWDKIKAYDILDTIEELEALFREKPYGKCMRKYTAYPWCKENFFFGSPEELLEYYKNFTGIPFYMYYRIGQETKVENFSIIFSFLIFTAPISIIWSTFPF